MRSSSVSARAPAMAGRLSAHGARPPVASMIGAVGPIGPPPAHHALVGGRREETGVEGVCAGYGALGIGAGTATAAVTATTACAQPHSGKHGPLPCGAQVRAASSWAGRALRRSRSLRRLPRISRMSARSFPLNAEGHITTRGVTPRVYYFTVRTSFSKSAVRVTRRYRAGAESS